MLFFFNDTATTEIYTLSLHDALPILIDGTLAGALTGALWGGAVRIFLLHHVTWSINSVCHFFGTRRFEDRKSTRLNSSHANISYAVFCLKKKINQHPISLPLSSLCSS